MKRMKSLLAVLLVIGMLFSLAACADTEKVMGKLTGSWGWSTESIDGTCYQFYIFSADGTYQSVWYNENAPSKNAEHAGTFEIGSDEIVLTGNDGKVEAIITYTLEGETLTLVDVNSDRSGYHPMMKIEEESSSSKNEASLDFGE